MRLENIMEYYELYKIIGIDLGHDYLESIPKPPSPALTVVSDTSDDYEFWDWGPHVLHNQNNSERPFAIEYNDEQSYQWKKVHRYIRKERFKSILTRLLNCRGQIPLHILNIIRYKLSLKVIKRSTIWNMVRSILKEMKCRQYYNLIPQIIKHCTGLTFTTNPHDSFDQIINDFAYMDSMFDSTFRHKWNRSYFPNLRFVALTLLGIHGVVYDYHVPKLRTNRKLLILETFMKDVFI